MPNEFLTFLEVTDDIFDRALECVLGIMHPSMLEAFERSKSSDASAGTLDPQHAKQEWQQRCTPHDNSIAQLLVPTQEEDYKATMMFMVEVCLNSTVFTTQFEELSATQ